MPPVIGISSFKDSKPHKDYVTVSQNYVRSILMAGGLPLVLPVVTDPILAEGYLELIDGLLLTGGDEAVSPLLYGENPIPEVQLLYPERDAFEIDLCRKAMERDLPLLGVCRGHQTMNVAMGGTLYQDLFTQRPNTLGHLPVKMPVDTLYHTVEIEEDTLLAEIFNAGELHVNSYHHQAVRDVAPPFRVTALATDGVIEAMEAPDKTFALGVQWHPEDLTVKHPQFMNLFKAFVSASGSAT